jgi:hypothetical protein
MDELARLLTLLALVGVALTLVGGVAVWSLDDTRRIRRSLQKVLGAPPEPMLTAPGRGQGVGFDFGEGRLATAWDKGAWCLTYPLAKLMGAELIVDDQVAARIHRGEARRPLDRLAGAENHITLRFEFDDIAYPHFDLELWVDGDEGRRGRLSQRAAFQAAGQWLARVESMLRRPSAQAAVAPPQAPTSIPTAAPPPWDDDDDEEPEEALS